MGNTLAQDNAIKFSGNDLLISAAAGSGKTRTVISKIIEDIKKGGDVSRYLVVTYTNAAANELRIRLSLRLTEELSKDKTNRHLSSQLTKVGGADICTIDAFCLKLLRSNFDKVGVDGDLRIGDESELAVLRREVMEEVIDSFYESEVPDPDFLAVCDCYGDIRDADKLSEQLLTLHNSLSSTWKGTEFLLENSELTGDFTDTPFGKIILHYIETVADRYEREYEEITEECKKDTNTVNSYLPSLLDDLDIMSKMRRWVKCGSYTALRNSFANIEYLPFKAVKSPCAADITMIQSLRKKFKAEITEIKNKWLSLDIKAIEASYKLNAALCQSIYKILKVYETELEKRKKSYSVFDFNDVERYALRILYKEDGEISDIAREYSERYDKVYIDEYQDTNSVQDKIFCALSRKNRFMVGDIKQSIYRFRAAEPEIFSNCRKSFDAYGSHTDASRGVSIFMSENFRSDRGVIDFSNIVSDYTFGNTTAIDYDAKDRLVFPDKELPEGYVHEKAEIYLINAEAGDDSESESEGAYNPEAVFVAKKIRELIENGHLPPTEENPEGRVRPQDITILLRTRRRLKDYIVALENEGVSYEYLIDDTFFEKSEVLFILCLLNAIDSPAKDAFFAGALRSHIFGLSLNELVKIKRTIPAPSMYASCKAYKKNDGIKAKLDFFFEKIEKYREECRKLPAHKVISMLYADLGILGGCTLPQRKNLIKLYDMARSYEGSSYKGLGAFLRYTEKASADKVRESVGEKLGESVKIVTVHASKGLEYPICFLCDLGANYNKNDYTKPLLFERKTGVCGKVFRNDGLIKYETLMRRCAAMAIRDAGVEEEIRKLYVALTRASHKMIVTGKVKKPLEYMEKMKRAAKYPSEHAILKTMSSLDFVAAACAVPNDCFTLTVVDDCEDMDTLAKVESFEAVFSEEESRRIAEILEKRFDFVYEKEYLNKIPSKLSVSRLSPTVLDGTENEEVEQKASIDTYPRFLSEGEIKRTGAEIGTATHLFMQFCDLDSLERNGAEYELQRLLREKFISKSVSDLVNTKYIEAFIGSELFSDMKKAKSIIREFRFNVLFPASEFSDDKAVENEKALVQGVIDCIYETENGEIVLVDYKTDSVTYENYRSVLVSRHKNQLTYYKKACEMMLEKEISRVLLYSIPVAKSVEIKFKEE